MQEEVEDTVIIKDVGEVTYERVREYQVPDSFCNHDASSVVSVLDDFYSLIFFEKIMSNLVMLGIFQVKTKVSVDDGIIRDHGVNGSSYDHAHPVVWGEMGVHVVVNIVVSNGDLPRTRNADCLGIVSEEAVLDDAVA